MSLYFTEESEKPLKRKAAVRNEVFQKRLREEERYPQRASHIEFGEDEKVAFLKAYEEFLTVRQAMIHIGLPGKESLVAHHRKKYPGFNQKFREARLRNVDKLKEEAIRRAVDGIDKPVFYKGEIVGYERQYSDGILMRLIEANDDRYKRAGSQVNVGVAGAGKNVQVYVAQFGKETKDARLIQNGTGQRELPEGTEPDIDEDSYSI